MPNRCLIAAPPAPGLNRSLSTPGASLTIRAAACGVSALASRTLKYSPR